MTDGEVRDRLVAAAREAGTELRFGATVLGLGPPPVPGAAWRVIQASSSPSIGSGTLCECVTWTY
jgi:hypothetical protein